VTYDTNLNNNFTLLCTREVGNKKYINDWEQLIAKILDYLEMFFFTSLFLSKDSSRLDIENTLSEVLQMKCKYRNRI